jgi:hypothetical protein
MALAGLWENWRSSAGEWMRSFAIVTTAPNELCAELHNRMLITKTPTHGTAFHMTALRKLGGSVNPCSRPPYPSSTR